MIVNVYWKVKIIIVKFNTEAFRVGVGGMLENFNYVVSARYLFMVLIYHL